jgi:predicted Zn-dependent peptidase
MLGQSLGGFYLSRLTRNLRLDKAYIYDSNSTAFTWGNDRSVLMLRNEVAIDKIAPAIEQLTLEIRKIASEPPTGEELEIVRNVIVDAFAARLQTNEQIATLLDQLVLANLPPDYFDRYLASLRSVTSRQIAAAAKKYFHADDLAMVVAGPAKKVLEQLNTGGISAREMSSAPVQ